jgi:hypothetical protein
MGDTKPPARIYLRVRVIDCATRQFSDRDLRLDLAGVPPDVRSAIEAVLESDPGRRGLVAFRDHFVDAGSRPRIDDDGKDGAPVHHLSIPGYFEDEAGRPLDELRMMQIVAGSDDIIVVGNPVSVLRIGPSDMTRAEKWSVERANTLAHFLEVVDCLIASDWLRARTSVEYAVGADGMRRVTNFERPDVLVLNSVLVFIRQLMSEGDKLFRLATDYYCCHTTSDAKRWYVQERRERFNELLDGDAYSFPRIGVKGRDLLGLFFYGFGLIHRPGDGAAGFRAVVQTHGREQVVLAVQSVLQHVVSLAHNVGHVVRQDLAHWLASGQGSPPDRIGIVDLLGEPRPRPSAGG